MCFRHLFSLSLSLYIYIYIYIKGDGGGRQANRIPKKSIPKAQFSIEALFVFFFMYQKWEKEERLQISVW
jgi:hypothetical protein